MLSYLTANLIFTLVCCTFFYFHVAFQRVITSETSQATSSVWGLCSQYGAECGNNISLVKSEYNNFKLGVFNLE